MNTESKPQKQKLNQRENGQYNKENMNQIRDQKNNKYRKLKGTTSGHKRLGCPITAYFQKKTKDRFLI